MTQQVPAQPPEIRPIGAIAAQNIAQATGMTGHVKEIEQAISDEIQLMSSHFTMMFAEAETTYEANLLKLKTQFEAEVSKFQAAFLAVWQNKWLLAGVAAIIFASGIVVGRFAL